MTVLFGPVANKMNKNMGDLKCKGVIITTITMKLQNFHSFILILYKRRISKAVQFLMVKTWIIYLIGFTKKLNIVDASLARVTKQL